MSFPFQMIREDLEIRDLKRFELIFGQMFRERVDCDSVFFLARSSGATGEAAGAEEEAPPRDWQGGAALVMRDGRPVVERQRQRLYLPLWREDGLAGVAIAEGVLPSLLDGTEKSLVERSRLISREFATIRKWGLDPLTGLLNGGCLEMELAALLTEMRSSPAGRKKRKQGLESQPQALTLALLEAYPKGRDAGRAMEDIAKTAACVDALVGHYCSLHHLGCGLFAMLWNGVDAGRAVKMGKMVLRLLQEEGVKGCHLGLNTVSGQDQAAAASDLAAHSRELLEQAWQALDMARQRGGSSLFAYESLRNSAASRLGVLPDETKRELEKLWQGVGRFALVALAGSGAQAGKPFSRRALSLAGRPAVSVGPDQAFVFLADMDASAAGEWLNVFRRQCGEGAVGGNFAAGIAAFPCQGYRKADLPANARKALLHARFYGDGGVARFDDVSLNVSGDLYYNEGDLAAAVREYERGLALNPKSINLLNSLAVCHAQMKHPRRAMALFEQVLALAPDDFMALYNLGFAFLEAGRRAEAIGLFERAALVDGRHVDLLLQLGALYSEDGNHRAAVTVLAKAEEEAAAGRDDQAADVMSLAAVCRRLGEAHAGLGDFRQALLCLQRAVHYNPQDAEAVSLLGEIYALREKEFEIGMSLCRQAAAIDPGQWRFWLRLATVQREMGDAGGAVASLKEGLSRTPGRRELALLLADMLREQGLPEEAGNIMKKMGRRGSLPVSQRNSKEIEG